MSDTNGDHRDTRTALLDLLLTKVAEDAYPSTTMLDLIEELLTPRDVQRYAKVLMQKISADTYPSIDLMDRARQLSVG